MDMTAINSALHTIDTASSAGSMMNAVGIKMLDKTLELGEMQEQGMIQMMEQSVHPELGGNIDLYV